MKNQIIIENTTHYIHPKHEIESIIGSENANKLIDGNIDESFLDAISNKLNVSLEEARKIQKNYFQEYNTTLNGMIKNHKIDADEFLEFVHDVDLNFLRQDKMLEEQIRKLDGKKIIFKNV